LFVCVALFVRSAQRYAFVLRAATLTGWGQKSLGSIGAMGLRKFREKFLDP
jgi:hypothetical protein